MSSVRYKVNNDLVEEIHKVVVHKFKVSDSEDPDIYAAAPIWEWEQSDQGKFIMEHAVDKPIWLRNISYASYSYDYIIVAELEKKKLSEFYLKWGNPHA
jgi:hypothetical protein